MSQFLTVQQCIERTQGALGRTLLYDLAAKQKVRHTRIESKLLIDFDDLVRLLEENASGGKEKEAKPEPPTKRAKGGINLW